MLPRDPISRDFHYVACVVSGDNATVPSTNITINYTLLFLVSELVNPSGRSQREQFVGDLPHNDPDFGASPRTLASSDVTGKIY